MDELQPGTRVTRLAPLGAEVDGLDLRRPFDADALIRLLAERGVAVLRDQEIDDDAFVAALERLGPLTFTAGEEPLAHQPALNFVSNVGRTVPPRSVFHTDTSYVAEPPAFTALRAVAIPERGGETVFSDQYRAWGSLPPLMRERLDGATVLHGVSGIAPERQSGDTHTRHPLVRRHPISGRDALFLSTPERVSALELRDGALDGTESAELIAYLYAHSTREANCLRHRWRPGDVVMWDNRCTMHKADHSGVVGDRVMHRGMVAGERPLAA